MTVVSQTDAVWQRVRHFLGGSASGVGLVLAGHMFDTVKVRLQTTQADKFSGPWQCLRDTVRNEGVLALYKGASAPMVATGFINSVMFGLMGICTEHKKQARLRSTTIDNTRNTTTTNNNNSKSRLFDDDLIDVMQCGSIVGVFMAFIVTPVEVVKTKLQVQYNTPGTRAQYAGPIDCARQIFRQSGVAGLYKGTKSDTNHT